MPYEAIFTKRWRKVIFTVSEGIVGTYHKIIASDFSIEIIADEEGASAIINPTEIKDGDQVMVDKVMYQDRKLK